MAYLGEAIRNWSLDKQLVVSAIGGDGYLAILNAYHAGMEAAQKLNVRPMVVQQLEDPFDPKSKVLYQETVEDGECGFAYVQLKPANSKFVKYLIERGIAKKDSYHGGAYISISDFNQSYQKKSAFASAFAGELLKHTGDLKLKSVWSHSRLD